MYRNTLTFYTGLAAVIEFLFGNKYGTQIQNSQCFCRNHNQNISLTYFKLI